MHQKKRGKWGKEEEDSEREEEEEDMEEEEEVVEKEEEEEDILVICWLSVSLLLWYIFAPIGDLLVVKTLEDDWYITVKAYKFLV